MNDSVEEEDRVILKNGRRLVREEEGRGHWLDNEETDVPGVERGVER